MIIRKILWVILLTVMIIAALIALFVVSTPPIKDLPPVGLGTPIEQRITFSSGQLTVADLISQIGEPDSVYVVRSFSSEAACAGTLLAFIHNDVLAWLYPDESFVGVIASQSISSLMYLSPEEAEDWSMTDHWMLQWQGYMDYCDLAASQITEYGNPIQTFL